MEKNVRKVESAEWILKHPTSFISLSGLTFAVSKDSQSSAL